MNIYFKGAEKATTLLELMKLGYASGWKFEPTFSDEELRLTQCHSARRSLDDLLAIANTYFPNTTELDLLQVLKQVGTRYTPMYVDYCSNVERPVFRLVEEASSSGCKSFDNVIIEKDYCYEYKGTGNYSLKDIVEFFETI